MSLPSDRMGLPFRRRRIVAQIVLSKSLIHQGTIPTSGSKSVSYAYHFLSHLKGSWSGYHIPRTDKAQRGV